MTTHDRGRVRVFVTRGFWSGVVLLALAAGSAAQQRGQPQTPLARLQTNIERITKSVNAKWGVYIKCLETKEEIALNADETMETMSVIKIPLMVEVFRQIEAGQFSLSDRYTIQARDKRPGTGVMQILDEGSVLTIKDIITLMNVVSDNTATDILFEKVGGIDSVNKLMDDYGLKTIRATGPTETWFRALRAAPSAAAFHAEGKTAFGWSSPRDMGKLLEMISRGEAVNKKSSDQMLEIMRRQIYQTRIPKYVSRYRIPHKTGDFLPYVANDVGLLESSRHHIVLSIFTAHHYGAGAHLEDAIGRLAEQVANYFDYK